MSIFGHLFDQLEHDAKPLLSAAAKWAETEGLAIVKEVEAEIKSKAPAELASLFNATIGTKLGVSIPASATLSDTATDLLKTTLARVKAQEVSGSSLRASILNTGLEQALLLLKGKAGDTKTAPQPAAVTT
jgi:hypothetical protein